MKKVQNLTTWGVVKRQLSIIKQNQKSYVFLIMLINMICAGVLPLIAVFTPRIIIDYLTLNTGQETIINTIVILTSVALFCGIIVVICNHFDEGFFMGLRLKEFDILNLKYQEIDYANLEDSRFRDNAEVSTSALNGNNMGFEDVYHSIFKLLPIGFSIILYCILIGIFQPVIFIAALIGGLIIAIVNKGIARYVDKRKEDEAKAYRQKNYFYNTCYDFTYGKEIRVYNLQTKLLTDYKKKSYNYLTVLKDIARRKFLLGLFELIMLLIQDGLAYFFIIKGYYANVLTIGEVALYISAIIALSTALRSFTTNLSSLSVDAKYSINYFKFMDDKSFYSLKGEKTALPKNEAIEIEFKNVSFKYPHTDKWILKDFNFKISKGEKLAIVGVNGAGKSTIVKLITGLFDVNEGAILLNGINIKAFDQKEYQKMFSAVFQEVYIYACSVIENIIGTDTGEEARNRGIHCLAQVGLKKKIESLPNGYDTQLLKVIDENGVELSGGQNQKLAIARALYKEGNVVILDEPTANLDALAEAEIYQSFNDLVKSKTTIFISHRLSSTKFCDKIALFTEAGLSEYGNHEELMEKKAIYYQMFKTQGKYYQEGVDDNE